VKVLRPANSIKLYRGFPRFYRKCQACNAKVPLHCMLLMQPSQQEPQSSSLTPPLIKNTIIMQLPAKQRIQNWTQILNFTPDAYSNNLLPLIHFPIFITFHRLTRARRTSVQCMGILRASNFRFSLIMNAVSVTAFCPPVYFFTLIF